METKFEELDPQTCYRLLRTQSIGRLAISRPGAAPYVVPVNYSLVHLSIVFRTVPGTKLEMLENQPVSFEVDVWDADHRSGWSVVMEGPAYEASDREMEYRPVALDSVAEQQHSRWVRLTPDRVTGRRIVAVGVKPELPVLVPDPGLEDWHGGATEPWGGKPWMT